MTSFVLEADGGSRGNPGPAAYGTVILAADTGDVVAEFAGYLGETTNNVAEYTGLLIGLEYLAEHHSDAHVEARLDSKLVVEQMSGRWSIKNAKLREIALRARDAFPPDHVTYTWVPREQNKRADALVNLSLDAVSTGGSGQIARHHRTV